MNDQTPSPRAERRDDRGPRVHGVIASFRRAPEVYRAAERIRDLGWTRWDVHTPYPVHGLDAAMGLPRSSIPRLTLLGGLTGLEIRRGGAASSSSAVGAAASSSAIGAAASSSAIGAAASSSAAAGSIPLGVGGGGGGKAGQQCEDQCKRWCAPHGAAQSRVSGVAVPVSRKVSGSRSNIIVPA